MSKTLSVAAIKEGTVIDHIPAGSAFIILQLLKLSTPKHRISLGLNFSSSSMGHKDLIKIENRALTEKEDWPLMPVERECGVQIHLLNIRQYRLQVVEKRIPLLHR